MICRERPQYRQGVDAPMVRVQVSTVVVAWWYAVGLRRVLGPKPLPERAGGSRECMQGRRTVEDCSAVEFAKMMGAPTSRSGGSIAQNAG